MLRLMLCLLRMLYLLHMLCLMSLLFLQHLLCLLCMLCLLQGSTCPSHLWYLTTATVRGGVCGAVVREVAWRVYQEATLVVHAKANMVGQIGVQHNLLQPMGPSTKD